MDMKGWLHGACGNGTVKCLDCEGGYIKLNKIHVMTLSSATHTHTRTRATSITKKSGLCRCRLMAVMLCESYASCWCWRSLGEGARGPPCTCYCTLLSIYNYFQRTS